MPNTFDAGDILPVGNIQHEATVTTRRTHTPPLPNLDAEFLLAHLPPCAENEDGDPLSIFDEDTPSRTDLNSYSSSSSSSSSATGSLATCQQWAGGAHFTFTPNRFTNDHSAVSYKTSSQLSSTNNFSDANPRQILQLGTLCPTPCTATDNFNHSNTMTSERIHPGGVNFSGMSTPHQELYLSTNWNDTLLAVYAAVCDIAEPGVNIQVEGIERRIHFLVHLAAKSLAKHSFFTLPHFLGPRHAGKLYTWAKRQWDTRPHLFKPGKLTASCSHSRPIRSDLVTWLCPDAATPSFSMDPCPEVKLLFAYMDAVVFALSPHVVPLNGGKASIRRKTWAMFSGYTHQSGPPNEAVGYEAHYDNPAELSDGRILTVIYYLNPNWSKQNGGQLVVWPYNQKYGTGSSPLAILPTLDRIIIFYSDVRTLHRVQPLLPTSMSKERFAITVWYFEEGQRCLYLQRQARHSLGHT